MCIRWPSRKGNTRPALLATALPIVCLRTIASPDLPHAANCTPSAQYACQYHCRHTSLLHDKCVVGLCLPLFWAQQNPKCPVGHTPRPIQGRQVARHLRIETGKRYAGTMHQHRHLAGHCREIGWASRSTIEAPLSKYVRASLAFPVGLQLLVQCQIFILQCLRSLQCFPAQAPSSLQHWQLLAKFQGR